MAEVLCELKSTLKKEVTCLYKEAFGKGPGTTDLSIFDNVVIVRFSGALTKMEENLAEKETGKKMVQQLRQSMVYERWDSYVPALEKTAGEKIRGLTHYLDLDRNEMYLLMIFEEKL